MEFTFHVAEPLFHFLLPCRRQCTLEVGPRHLLSAVFSISRFHAFRRGSGISSAWGLLQHNGREIAPCDSLENQSNTITANTATSPHPRGGPDVFIVSNHCN